MYLDPLAAKIRDGSDYLFVTLLPEMSHIATSSLLGYTYSHCAKRGAMYQFWLFNGIQCFFSTYTSYTHKKFISVISMCFKQATLQ